MWIFWWNLLTFSTTKNHFAKNVWFFLASKSSNFCFYILWNFKRKNIDLWKKYSQQSPKSWKKCILAKDESEYQEHSKISYRCQKRNLFLFWYTLERGSDKRNLGKLFFWCQIFVTCFWKMLEIFRKEMFKLVTIKLWAAPTLP